MEHGTLYKRHAVKHVVFIVPVLVIERGYGYAIAIEQRFRLPDLHHSFRVPVGQWLEQGRVEYAEHGDIRADSKRHCDERSYRKAGRSEEPPNAVLDMTQHNDLPPPLRLPCLLPGGRRPSLPEMSIAKNSSGLK